MNRQPDTIEHKYANFILELKIWVLIYVLAIISILYNIVNEGFHTVKSDFGEFLPYAVSFLFVWEFLPWLIWKLTGGYKKITHLNDVHYLAFTIPDNMNKEQAKNYIINIIDKILSHIQKHKEEELE